MKLKASPKSLVIVFLTMIALIGVSSKFLSGVRWDLTESGLYTLSDGTKSILSKLDQPVQLTLFFSDKGSAQLPALRTYAQRVEELLGEYVNLSNGKLSFEKVDPVPFSEAEDEAALAGLQGVPAGSRGEEIFFGLRVKNEAGAQEVIPFMQPDREAFLEYELTKLISSLSKSSLPKLAIYSGIEINGGYDFMTRQSRPAWSIVSYLEEGFELNWIEDDATSIDGDLLVLVAPQNLSEQMQFAIDQFVLKGGRTLVFLDPYAESLAGQSGMPSVQRSDLDTLLPSWGLTLRDDAFVTDFANSMVVRVAQGSAPVRHIGLMSLDPQQSGAANDIVLHGLESMNWSSVGILDTVEGATTQIEAMLRSSDQAMPQSPEKLTTLANPEDLMDEFAPTGEQYLIAARVSGPAKTAFPEGISVEVESEASTDGEASSDATSDDESSAETEQTKTETLLPTHTSADNIHVFVVADSDLLTDRLWVQVQNFFGQQIVTPWADNGNFVINAVENYSGDPDLIEIRSQGRFNRPFDKVEALRLAAEERFLETQELLEQELQATEAKLMELESLRGADDGAMFTDEQASELESFQVEKLKIRKQLRDVQHQLDQDIESLGTNLKLINIFLVPLLVCGFALLVSLRRKLT